MISTYIDTISSHKRSSKEMYQPKLAANMTITCPQENCSRLFQSQEELTSHQEKHHSVVKDGSLPRIGAHTSSGIHNPAPTTDTNSKSSVEENSVSEKASPRLQEQLPRASHSPLNGTKVADTHLKAKAETSTTSTASCGGNATHCVNLSNTQRRFEHQEPTIHKYEVIPIGITPRTWDGKVIITNRYHGTRSLELGLKDLTLDELLGYSSSDQESESEFSNYSHE
ncbi:hypothetical protein BKA65DRAFT_267708 [Rhexocercosporidium sp. MPI-PUGE-AT-0058]|nr:hypothetical protein BKA65DRAFT_267708 [Rhexocercosporidium sp. MPI-PUGE-AT-0058]